MDKKGLVSCIIPTYKRSDSLCRAIDSVLSQTYSNVECIVVNDNERNDEYSQVLYQMLKEYNEEPRFVLVEQDKHINGAEARNAGIRASRGEYVAFLDDDDEWLPQKLEKQITILNADSTIDGVSCLYQELAEGKVFHSCPPYTGDGLHKKVFQREVAVFTSTIVLRREALLNSGIFDNTLRRHQDLQLLLDFTKEHKMAVLNEYLVYLHSDSSINRPSYEKLVDIKKDFFRAVASHLDLYSKREQRQIKAAHRFELAIAAFREHRWLTGMKQIVKVGFNIPAYKCLMKRIRNRKLIVQ